MLNFPKTQAQKYGFFLGPVMPEADRLCHARAIPRVMFALRDVVVQPLLQ